MSTYNEEAIALADELMRIGTDYLEDKHGARDAAVADRMEELHAKLTRAAWQTRNAEIIETVSRAGDAVRDACAGIRADATA